MNKYKTLIIAAIVMLVAATSAFGYHEQWTGWFSTGTLIPNSNGYEYVRNGTGGTADDTSHTDNSGHDHFYYDGSPFVVAFVYSPLDDTIYLAIDSVSGTKVTGQTSTKEGSGYWGGSAIRRKNSVEETWNTVYGYWNTEGDADFDYTTSPPSYYAYWYVYPTTSISGYGTSSGERTHSD